MSTDEMSRVMDGSVMGKLMGGFIYVLIENVHHRRDKGAALTQHWLRSKSKI